MQRDLGNEVIVAIVAVGILAFAITFAIILSLSSPSSEIATVTPSDATVDHSAASTEAAPSVTITSESTSDQETPTSPAAKTPVASELPPTDNDTQAEAESTQEQSDDPTEQPSVGTDTKSTSAAGNTESPTSSISVTVVVLTSTAPSPSATRTPQPSVTPTRTLLPTNTPTKTFTPTPSFTSTATATPTRTPLPTRTSTPSRTPTPTSTWTPTRTPTPTLTRTPRPTETSGIRPTPTGALTAAAYATISGCTPPSDWVRYVVRQGDTLFSIAQSVGSSLGALQVANCIADPDNIFAGQIILVPREPDLTAFPPGQSDGNLSSEGCTDPNSVITNLQPGQTASGIFPLMGTASLPDFSYYKIEVRPDFASVYNFYTRSETPITNGQLAQIDQRAFGTGLHWIKLTVIGGSAGATPCAIPVYFQ